MRAVQATAFGGPEVLAVTTLPDKEAAPGEVVVAVAAAGVLSVDTMIRSGRGGDVFPVRPPYVPGLGVAGQVESVGAGVDGQWIGRRVLADVDSGGYAEQVVAEVARLIPIPDALGSREAMALLHDGSTALALFEAVDLRQGESVLVQPAAGGLGSLLVQLARNAGAHVIGAARGSRKLELAKDLGADVVVDYSAPAWTDQLHDVQVVFDGVGGELGRAAFETTARGGRFSNYGFAGGTSVIDQEDARRRGVTMHGMEQLTEFQPNRLDRAQRVLREAAAGRIRPVIGQIFPLEKAAEAHAALEARGILGKALLVP
ncbi:zinc-binding dehydrogenase [Saccharopolyspora sp. K220]|uniref:zinc-binding dehydrogenase n=1 Tax=Saccharopolyspora soli TaxID=2926618 RepID=UPI001F59F212|nr:zinc-binding dehydrogenase [Saccharopolyspora soli]MCI2417946.1 zinc-binding dehydrogenase [Saccharopolyspora soli]